MGKRDPDPIVQDAPAAHQAFSGGLVVQLFQSVPQGFKRCYQDDKHFKVK